jgi:prepilin-type N-terminal cleavage/methylation domain-containing protein
VKKGFTLPEVLITIVIIALLAAMAIPSYQTAKKQTEQNKRQNIEHMKCSKHTEYDPVRSKSQPFECSQILEVDGVKVYRFRENTTKEWTYLTISVYGGSKASIGH